MCHVYRKTAFSRVHINNHFSELTDAVKFMPSEETKITNFKLSRLRRVMINDESA